MFKKKITRAFPNNENLLNTIFNTILQKKNFEKITL